MMSANAGADAPAAHSKKEEKEAASRRYAMISVYYRSLGSQLESRGAPVMAVPPDVRPLSFGEALDRLKDSPQELWGAYWCIVRSVPIDGSDDSGVRRYPPELLEQFKPGEIADLDRRRREARANADLLAAILVAYARRDQPQVDDLLALLPDDAVIEFDGAAHDAVGYAPYDLVRQFVKPDKGLRYPDDDQGRRADELKALQDQVGLNLHDFVEDFLDTIVFAQFMRERAKDVNTPLTSSCIVRQDTNTLTTTATVTSLVRTSFDALVEMLDPLGWPKNSDVIQHTRYVRSPYDLRRAKYEKTAERSFGDRRFLYEDVAVTWGYDSVQTGSFTNVLVVNYFRVNNERRSLDLPFRLCRSIESRILWDRRAGGILVDDGYIIARPVGKKPEGEEPELFRLTARKILRFSDRTPYSSAPGLLDFGQMLNYLSPAAVTWWLETDMYSPKRLHCAGDDSYAPPAAGDKAEEES